MGYYQERKKKKSISGFIIPGVAGLCIGGLLFGGVLPQFDPTQAESSDEQPAESLQTSSHIVTSDVTDIVEATTDAVVGITNLQTMQQNPFAAPTTEEPDGTEAGAGSGVIYKKEDGNAFIVTNNHVVEGAEDVLVTLADGSELDAEVLGTDVWTDLAVLQVPGESIDTVAELGDSSQLKAGEPVIAIGNPLGLQFSGSVTTGVISGLERLVPIDINGDGTEDWQAEVLQTDAAINPGNSGGALLNNAGQVIGINSMKIAQASVEGIGLAIPVNSAVPIIEDLEELGEVERPSMGAGLVDLAEVPPQFRQSQWQLPAELDSGAVVESVLEGSGADEAGLEALDIVTEVDGEEMESVIEIRQYLYNEKKAGEILDIEIYRGGETLELEIELSESLS